MQPKLSSTIKYHAGLYIRLSKEDEAEGASASVINQQSLLLEFTSRNQLEVYDTYIDDGWSGTNFERPNFKRMLSDIDAGNVNMVITKDLSRLGRDYILVGHYMERYFPEKRVRYISLLDGIDTGTDSTANDITPFRAIMNDMYAKDISRKVRSVKHDKQRKGQFIGGKPAYGYRMHPSEKNRIVIDAEAAHIVQRIFTMALDGASCRQIAMRLNDEGVPSPAVYAGLAIAHPGPYTGLWSAERISNMLQNETYIGNMVQGRTKKVSYKSRKCLRQAPEDWIIVPDTHAPLIEPEAFQTVRAILASRRHTRRRTYDFPLKGLIFCHECGHPLAVLNRKNAQGEDVLYLVCRTYQRSTKAGVCGSHIIKEQAVAAAVVSQARELCRQWLHSQELLPIAQAAIQHAEQTAPNSCEAQALHTRIESLTARLDRIYIDNLNGLLAKTDFERLYQRTSMEREAAQATLTNMEQTQSLNDTSANHAALAETLVDRFINDAFASREVLISLIERVELTADKQLIIRFRFREPDLQ